MIQAQRGIATMAAAMSMPVFRPDDLRIIVSGSPEFGIAIGLILDEHYACIGILDNGSVEERNHEGCWKQVEIQFATGEGRHRHRPSFILIASLGHLTVFPTTVSFFVDHGHIARKTLYPLGKFLFIRTLLKLRGFVDDLPWR